MDVKLMMMMMRLVAGTNIYSVEAGLTMLELPFFNLKKFFSTATWPTVL